ncbi:MAG TPA: retroviral-like aspartic protease family protein [Gemmatimonadaceae bacterium]|nr:retroviral-like aspartic protease family protein [Gemmatimonadaceae bacterium]
MSRRAVIVVAAVSIAAMHGVGAQANRMADSLLTNGALDRAESTYYAAARVRPRDPAARWALGRYLVARGAPRVGVTLMEEAVQFGGDQSLISADLAPVYLSLGMYHELAALSPSISAADRDRARWLESHPTRLVSPDSILTVAYKKSVVAGEVGRVALEINGRTVDAVISTHAQGIVLADTGAIARKLRRFDASTGESAARAGATPAVADSISVGKITFRNFPVTMQPLTNKVQAVVGMDVVARFAPTFDPRAERITLRLAGVVATPQQNVDVYSTLLTPVDLRILRSGHWISSDNAQMAKTFSERRWTFDARHGRIVVER